MAKFKRYVSANCMRVLSVRGESGINRFGTLLIVLLIGAVVFCLTQIFPFYYYYFEIQGYIESQAEKAQAFEDEKIRENILKHVEYLEIPLEDPRDLVIRRFAGKIEVSMEYEEVLYLPWGDGEKEIWVFKFNPSAKKTY